MTYTPMPNSVAGRAMAELRRNGRTAERALADAIDTDVDTLRSSVWHAEQDKQLRRAKVMGLWWYELMVPVLPATAPPATPAPQPSNEELKPEASTPAPREKAYMPKPGSFAARAIIHLRQHGAARLKDLAAELGSSGPNLKSCLVFSVEAGLVQTERRGAQLWYRVDAQPVDDADPVEAACEITAAAEQLEQAALDRQERAAQDRLLELSTPLLQLPRELMPPAPCAPSEIEKRLRHTIQELESALAARDLRIAALLEQAAPAAQPVDLRVTLSICGTAHQAERISAFVRSMTEVRT
jgi:hypothetical protein